MAQPPARWSVDRRIPAWGIILLVFTCLGSTAGAAAAVGRLSQRVDSVVAAQAVAAEDHDRIVALQQQVLFVQATLNRIEARQIARSLPR